MISTPDWYQVSDTDAIPSPALLVYAPRVINNIETLIASVSSLARLRPHVKSHKMAEIARLMIDRGVNKFKAATYEEADMLGRAGAADVLIAYPVAGPNAARLLALRQRYPDTVFSVIADHISQVRGLSNLFSKEPLPVEVYIDLNVGMNRTGILPATAPALAAEMIVLPGIRLVGLHAYDGHIHDKDAAVRRKAVANAFEDVYQLRENLEKSLGRHMKLVAGGSPTYMIHAERADTELSPGTFIFWDRGYRENIPEESFEYAALLLCRIISIPSPEIICVDLGYKSVASENAQPRVSFLNAPDAKPLAHSEEHLTLTVPDASIYRIGDVLYGVPTHICPSVAMYSKAHVIENGKHTGTWLIARR